MRSDEAIEAATAMITAGLDALTELDPAAPPAAPTRAPLLTILNQHNRLAAHLTRLTGAFDHRGLAPADAQRTTKDWLQAFGRLTGAAAHAQVTAVRTLTLLPQL